MPENKSFEDYKKEYLEEVHINAQIDGTTYDDFFFNDSLNKLVAMGEFIDPEIFYINKKGKNGRIMSFDAKTYDYSDRSLILISNDFKDSLDEVINRADLEKIFTRMLNFIEEAYNDQLENYFDKFDDVVKMGHDISKRLHIDYVDLKDDQSIDKIKLYVITNKNLSERIKDFPSTFFMGKKVEYKIWSLFRFYEHFMSGREREPIIINCQKYGLKGIPCIKAEMIDNLDYDAYLAIVPGTFLNDIYYEHGSRLLEGNVRSFLSARGKINSEIRKTILNNPTKFFTYNNGIACTASQVILSDDGHEIVQMDDLQIINGGQTTASLASASLKDHANLHNIFVPMKLTVVKNDDYDEMISNISKYSNKQNGVTDADFFSNNPFHRTFEALSKKVQAPAKNGEIDTTYWYYERSRGKFEQEMFKYTRDADKKYYLKRHPKHQVIKKEELAKYYTCAELMRPDIVSKGSQAVMKHFAKFINEKFAKNKEMFNEEFFKLCVGYAILFKETDKIVNQSDWYIAGGAKSGIVSYSISKLVLSLPSGTSINYDRIWKNQELYPSLRVQIENIAKIADKFILDSHGAITTEYCKREETWENFKKIKIELNSDFVDDLIDKDIIDNKINSETKNQKLSAAVSIESQIINYGGPYWRRLIDEGNKRKILSPKEIDLLKIPASIDTMRPRIPSEAQAKLIWKIRKKLEDAGVLVD